MLGELNKVREKILAMEGLEGLSANDKQDISRSIRYIDGVESSVLTLCVIEGGLSYEVAEMVLEDGLEDLARIMNDEEEEKER